MAAFVMEASLDDVAPGCARHEIFLVKDLAHLSSAIVWSFFFLGQELEESGFCTSTI